MGGTVTFTDTSTGVIAAWLWNFGDGNTSVLQNPVHVYTVAGIYTVTLTVTGVYGATSNASQIVGVNAVTNIVYNYV